MLNSFFISNFRLFKRLELPELGRVNLIVGKNGSGKSALLEAIHLYVKRANFNVISESIISRQEIGIPFKGEQGLGAISALRHLFYGHTFPEFDSEGIRIGISGETDQHIHITKAAFITKSSDGSILRHRVKFHELPDDLADIDPYLVIEEDDDKVVRIVGLQQDFDRQRRFYSNVEDSPFIIQVVSTQTPDVTRLASLWDTIALTDLEKEIISGVQLIEPKITDLTFVEENRRPKNRIPLVKVQGFDEPYSLKSRGDGVMRLLHIVLSLVNAKDGILLIDEFENGLHWKIHPKIWGVVFQLSKKLNVQVFATTHSQDCIRGFEKAWRDHLNAGRFLRLDVKDGNVKPTYYQQETLSDALRLDVEVR